MAQTNPGTFPPLTVEERNERKASFGLRPSVSPQRRSSRDSLGSARRRPGVPWQASLGASGTGLRAANTKDTINTQNSLLVQGDSLGKRSTDDFGLRISTVHALSMEVSNFARQLESLTTELMQEHTGMQARMQDHLTAKQRSSMHSICASMNSADNSLSIKESDRFSGADHHSGNPFPAEEDSPHVRPTFNMNGMFSPVRNVEPEDNKVPSIEPVQSAQTLDDSLSLNTALQEQTDKELPDTLEEEDGNVAHAISFQHDVAADAASESHPVGDHFASLVDLRVCSIGFLFECLDTRKRGKLTAEDLLELFEQNETIVEKYPECEETSKDPLTFIESVTRILRGAPKKELFQDDVQAIIRTPDLEKTFGHLAEDVMLVCEVFKSCVVREQAAQVADKFNVRRSFLTATKSADIAHLIAKHHTDRRMQIVETAKTWDPFVMIAILSNALCFGVSLDNDPEWIGWDFIEWAFTTFFVTEIVGKCMMSGVLEHFWGKDWHWNMFDAWIVLIAVFDAVVTLFGSDYLDIWHSADDLGVFRISLLRIARLARVSRLLRILRLQALKELTLMINGLILGLRTIFWAIILLTVVCYAIGLLVRQTIGEGETAQKELFHTVPRAMFTIYRCCVGECTDTDGSPLAITLHEEYGWPIMVGYVGLFMLVGFGLFNLILAVFVEKTLALAKLSDRRRHEGIVAEKVRVARMINNVVKKLLLKTTEIEEQRNARRGSQAIMLRSISGFLRLDGPAKDERFSRAAKMQTKVTRDIFEAALEDEEVLDMFEDLDISVDGKSKFKLFDALDANADGKLQVSELVDGLLRLRGPADKIDAMSAAMGVRQIQDSLKRLEAGLLAERGSIMGSEKEAPIGTLLPKITTGTGRERAESSPQSNQAMPQQLNFLPTLQTPSTTRPQEQL